jgi:alkylation response protein AidB-like acyl-CoA dehydrogenase
MISFEPTDDQRMMQESVAAFARMLRARCRDFERDRALPEDVRKTAHELGLTMLGASRELDLVTSAVLEETIAYGDPAAAFGFGGPGAFGLAVRELASAEHAEALVASIAPGAFGAVACGEKRASQTRPGLATRATSNMGSWEITGEKAYVVNADRAARFVVFAQVDESKGWRGLGAFVVDRSAPGLTVLPRETSLGLDVASFGGIKLDGVEVDEGDRLDGRGDFDAALVRFFAKYALLVAARDVGLARAAFDVARDYCEQRRAFGKPIGHFQAVAFTLADRAMDVDAARALVWRAASAWDQGASEKDALLSTARAVAFAHEAAMRCGDDAVQLHGGAGFMRDYPVEKWMRDAKQLALCAMTAEHCDQLAAAIELGRPIDPGEVLPSPESQNAFV